MTQETTSKTQETTPNKTHEATGKAYDKEHIKALLEEGYNSFEIAETMNHSTEWVLKHINIVLEV